MLLNAKTNNSHNIKIKNLKLIDTYPLHLFVFHKNKNNL